MVVMVVVGVGRRSGEGLWGCDGEREMDVRQKGAVE